MSTDGGTGTINKEDVSSGLKKPPLYNVILHNDDYTSMDFVVAILKSIFHLSDASANAIMMSIHEGGQGVAGTFTREVAETKALQTMSFAKENEFPLEATIEPN